MIPESTIAAPKMTFFNPGIFFKEKPICKHPWEHRIKAKYSGTPKYSHNSVENPLYPAPKTEELKRLRFIVIGNRVTREFIYCMHLVRGLHKCRRRQFEDPIVRGLYIQIHTFVHSIVIIIFIFSQLISIRSCLLICLISFFARSLFL